MIFETLTDSNSMPLCGMATQVGAINIPVPEDEYSPDFCYCLYECNEPFEVWGGGSTFQNDKTTFLFRRAITSDTGVITIWKNGSQVATISNNDYGAWKSSYTADSLQYSFIADWNLIYNAFGYGEYQIKNSYTSFGVAKTFESRDFVLVQYSDYGANGWVKFDWSQNSNIESSIFDFTESIDFSFKMKGLFKIAKPETIKDAYQTSARDSKIFRTEQKNNYTFNSNLVRDTDLKMINENMLLADKLTIYDFNLMGTNFKGKELSFLEVSNFEDFRNNRNFEIGINFNDYKQNIIK